MTHDPQDENLYNGPIMNYMVNKNAPNPWDLDAEAIVVKIRWFGVLIGYFLVNATDMSGDRRGLLNLILAIGVGYTLLDTYFSWKKKSFPSRLPFVYRSYGIAFHRSTLLL